MRECIAMLVDAGCLIPADHNARLRLRELGLRRGDLAFITIVKLRNPRFHRLAHRLGQLMAESVEAFEGMGAHRVLKRLQLESGVGCEEIAYRLAGQTVVQRIPLSLSFGDMDEIEFEETYKGICRQAAEYWHDLDADDVARMVELMPDNPQ
ncbi:MAG: hypothetical protein K2Y51_26110 [Gammaproteobacteria bacterium]|nr:hypothetical protein [Gammaproteobacteria bacterium]